MLLTRVFTEIADPRRAQGRRHPLPVVLAIAAAATLCGMRGYKAIAEWADDLGQKARARFRCRHRHRRYTVPSESIIRDVLIRVDPEHLDQALQRWNALYSEADESLAIDGKTMCNAIDEDGHQTHILSAVGHRTHTYHTQKKVGALPVEGDDELKRTNEIKMAAPLLDAIDIRDKLITADALSTQRAFATYPVEERQAHYHFTVKGNQPGLLEDLTVYFQNRQQPDFVEQTTLAHGRIETRRIRTTTALNDYLDFPHVAQAFVIERERIEKTTGKRSTELAYGVTSRPPEQANAQRVLATNRRHRCIENSCHYIIDWNFDEDRSRIRTAYGPENTTRLRRFAIGLIKSKGAHCVAQKMRQLNRNTRLVFDYLRMSKNTCPALCG